VISAGPEPSPWKTRERSLALLHGCGTLQDTIVSATKRLSFNKIASTKSRPTSGHGFEFRSGLYGLALLLGELVLEPFLLGGHCLMDLLELLLKVDNLLLLLYCIL
jgi:hypothetical protein